MRNYLQHARRHRRFGSDPLFLGVNAYMEGDSTGTLVIPPGFSVFADWTPTFSTGPDIFDLTRFGPSNPVFLNDDLYAVSVVARETTSGEFSSVNQFVSLSVNYNHLDDGGAGAWNAATPIPLLGQLWGTLSQTFWIPAGADVTASISTVDASPTAGSYEFDFSVAVQMLGNA